MARLAARTDGEHQIRRLLLGAGALVAVLGFVGWLRHAGSQHVPDLDVSSAAYRTLLLFVLDDNGVIEPPVMLNVARFLAPFVAAAAAVALFVTGVRRWLQHRLAASARDHIVLLGDLARAQPYAAGDLGGARMDPTTVHVGPDPHAPGGGCLHVEASWDDPTWVAASSALQARLVVLATGADDQTLQALDVLLDSWGAEGPAGVHVELQDRSTATWLSISLARSHPDRSIEVCCYEEGLARQAISDMLATIEADEPALQLAVIGDGALVDLLVIEAADALAALHRRRGGPRPTLLVADHPRADAIAARFVRFAAHVGVAAVPSLREVVARTNETLLAVVTFRDEAKTLRVAAELAAREPNARVFVPARRSFQALGLRSLDPTAAHRTGALDGPFTRAARLLGAARRWHPWEEWSDAERRTAATWIRSAVGALLTPDGFAGEQWIVDQEVEVTAPEPLPRVVARALVAQLGSLERSPDGTIVLVDHGSAESATEDAATAVIGLPTYLFDAADLLVHTRPNS